MNGQAYVYIMSSQRNGTIYLGATMDLVRRAWEHRNDVVVGFTKKCRCHALVWFEAHGEWDSARLREKRTKEWRRAWKLREIELMNPTWENLYDRIAAG